MEKGYYDYILQDTLLKILLSQSTIKMEKGYYFDEYPKYSSKDEAESQSTIKMEKGYYSYKMSTTFAASLSQSTIKMEKGYYPKPKN